MLKEHSVVIVGAGCAGLACAQQLLGSCPDLLLVEAGPCPGGRVREVGAISIPAPELSIS